MQGAETNLTFENKLPESIEIFWLSSVGVKVSYGKIKPGEKHSQHTFEHHIWLIQDSMGKLHSAYKAQAEKAIVRITKNSPAPQQQKNQEPSRLHNQLRHRLLHNQVVQQMERIQVIQLPLATERFK
jgi:hypothetical protein